MRPRNEGWRLLSAGIIFQNTSMLLTRARKDFEEAQLVRYFTTKIIIEGVRVPSFAIFISDSRLDDHEIARNQVFSTGWVSLGAFRKGEILTNNLEWKHKYGKYITLSVMDFKTGKESMLLFEVFIKKKEKRKNL